MRKFALPLAAALVVSVPLSAIVTTDSYAAKKMRHHHRVARVAAPAPVPTGPKPPFHDIWRALDDLGGQLAAAGRR
jgi:hypothetical protein